MGRVRSRIVAPGPSPGDLRAPTAKRDPPGGRSKLNEVSFRARLTSFFLLIVVLPMIAIAVGVIAITDDSRSGKADARLSEGLVAASALYRDDLRASGDVVGAIARDSALQAAARAGDPEAIAAAARRVAQRDGARSFIVRGANGGALVDIGTAPIAAATAVLSSPGGGRAATLEASGTTPRAFVAEVKRRTNLDLALRSGNRDLAGTIDLGSASVPGPGSTGNLSASGADLRAASVALPGPGGYRLTVVGPRGSSSFLSSRPLVVGVLVVFFAIALLLAARLLTALNARIRDMLGAARRIGEGDFSQEVPVEGNDEMASLAREFNKMSDRLAAQIGELRHQRDEIERSVRRIGEAFASGLDRDGLMRIVIEAALSACNAEYGIIAIGGAQGGEFESGSASSELRDASLEGEERASREGALVEYASDGIAVLSSPVAIPGEPARRGGAMSIARDGTPFDAGERDVFAYLLGQMAASIENIALHEAVSEEAVTDDLTGLSNKRRFRELLTKEAARAERFTHDLSLLMLDIDDFKQVNDTYGHLQGDAVLRGVAEAIAGESRGIDEPARYGGEEFVIVLPETDIAGAAEVGERIRERIEELEFPRMDGNGGLGVTASIGVATANGDVKNVETLIAAADAALYEAKAAGKNRVAKAGEPA